MPSIKKIARINIKKTLNFGIKKFCPICASHIRSFNPYGVNKRPNAVCPICFSLERHRLMWLYFRQETDLFQQSPKKMLHIAPEACFMDRFSSLSHLDYLPGDLDKPGIPVVDLTEIDFPNNHFDIVYCSHVLEHVPNDIQAMKELARVVKSSGWAILQVPIVGDYTQEDLSITNPTERARLYGQPDHVRQYGKDYKDRLEEAGFQVQVIPYLSHFTDQESEQYGFGTDNHDIYLCRSLAHS
ncbi:class I SAM-dependent methyltransferase [Acaryochloris sp. IP29b_bin.148]|uniref:class I SAM-dependent methyltransferase n=1 Tax=Acaryochloris sp. IP29b_bin.148 TaxID=2969218 RepID=UPI0026096645|nr:class I SAM-dependent methyltransferase [Acaryochloris sp. IP29b_bin.148]